MKKLLLILLSASVFFCVSCSDECTIKTNYDMAEKCNTRIVSIEKFNANFTTKKGENGKMESKLDSTYNIGMFKFPENESYSGSFPNDVNFEESTNTFIAKLFFNNKRNYVAIKDIFPSNNDMPGDILVKDVIIDPAASNVAMLRINGYIVPLDLELHTEDSQVFCDFIRANRAKITQAIRGLELVEASLYGQNLPNKIITEYSKLNFKIYDKNDIELGDVTSADVPKPSPEELDNFKKMVEGKTGLDFPVKSGELFGYITKNGVRFVFLVSEIRKSSIHPFRERVSIIFQEIR